MDRLLIGFLLCAAFGGWKYYTRPAPPPPMPLVAGQAAAQVVIYTTDWCGYCKKAKAHMKQRGIAYTEHDIEKDQASYADFKRHGGNGVPLILVRDKVMRGFDADDFDDMLTQ